VCNNILSDDLWALVVVTVKTRPDSSGMALGIHFDSAQQPVVFVVVSDTV